jgi:hypothetical protein
MRLALLAWLAAAPAAAGADPPPAIVALFRSLAEELADQNAPGFLDHLDREMPSYAQLREDVEALLARGYVVSSIDFTADEGDEDRRDVELDWLWRLNGGPPHRVLVKCRVERRGRGWKITRLEPADAFREK